MKKQWLAICVCSLLLFSACSRPEPAPPESSTPSSQTNSNVLQSEPSAPLPVGVNRTVDGERFSMDGMTVAGDIAGAADSDVFSNISVLYEKAPIIVYGSVEKIGYWDESGAGFTLCDFTTEKSYKGNIAPGDKISVLAAGGYYRLSKYVEINGKDRFPDMTDEEIETKVFKTAYMGAPFIEEGKKYLFFLDQISGVPPFPDGVYTEVGGFQGRFYYKDAETLMRHTPENEPNFYYDSKTRSIAPQEFTLPELEAEIAACAEE